MLSDNSQFITALDHGAIAVFKLSVLAKTVSRELNVPGSKNNDTTKALLLASSGGTDQGLVKSRLESHRFTRMASLPAFCRRPT
jgi:hypothetical protein